MDALLYLTVWISLSLFVLAELTRERTARPWPRIVSAAGLALMIVHILIAMDIRHGWQHASAIAATAQQTRDVYGLDWGGGVYVNYLFVAVWAMAIATWVPGCQGAKVPGFLGARVPGFGFRMASRLLFLVVIANAAIVFAAGWRRGAGVLLVGVLLFAWGRRVSPRRAV